MRLSARPITTYNTVNSYSFGNQWQIRSGEPNTLYFQLVDLDQLDGKTPLRRIPAVGATMQIKFPSIDDDQTILVTAAQVSASDTSLWSIPLTAVQTPASGNVIFYLTESAVIRSFSVVNMLVVEYPGSEGSC